MVSKVRNVRLGVFSGGGCHHPNNWDNYRSLEIRATLWREGGERRTGEEGEGRIAD